MSLASDVDLTEDLELWRQDPIAFFREILGVEYIWDAMTEMSESVRDNRRTAVAGCHNSSKTFTAACLAWWWVICHQPAVVFATSPKEKQLKDVFWNELTKVYMNAAVPLGGELLSLDWRLNADTFIVGRTSRKDIVGGATGMQGYKSPHLLLIMDEATAIDRAYFESAPGILTMPENRWVAMANPTNPNCGFHDCWRAGAPWYTMNIDALKTPNLVEGKIVHPFLPDADWVDDRRRDYGEGSPAWEARVRGQFPTAAIDTLISLADLDTAFDREPPADLSGTETWLGVDIARQGDDFSVIAVVRNDQLIDLEWFQIPDLMKVADQVVRVAKSHKITEARAHQIQCDATGLGVGVVDKLRLDGWAVAGEDFGSLPYDQKHYYDRRTELWVGLKEWIVSDASLSDAPIGWRRKLESDLCGCTVDRGRVKGGRTVTKLEDKPSMKKRLGHSPDYGDALALAVAWRTARRPIDRSRLVQPLAERVASARVNTREDPVRERAVQRRKNRKAGIYDREGEAGGIYDE